MRMPEAGELAVDTPKTKFGHISSQQSMWNDQHNEYCLNDIILG